ncbi:DNA-protecting protein DprA [Henriciella barbarensis]|uniref:DNA-protecting protein DprA n=1 Tax=Henriciella barbarensis TaxID=86342 RepID=A0A399QTG4_9PROT|nr:DNA-processing protein DprA [Henriciella barbarensis]RIJ22246.1 DNA-protecting protein DprA [Henriciella barbarensis]
MSAGFSDERRVYWLALARAPQVGPVTFFQLLAKYGSPQEAVERAGIRANLDSARRELDNAAQLGATILLSEDEDYPAALSELSPPPPVLTVLGDIRLLERPAIALVGARDASAAGRKIARELAASLGKAGLVIASGLARGIDGEAHQAALSTGTIAVLAGGVDQIYPPQHKALYHEIVGNGLIVSERAFGRRATAQDFPRRNRIITGLAVGTVVVEATERSGSLISARMAGEQGREVMAVPGSPLDRRAAGTNRLLREGATLVRHAEDALEAVASQIEDTTVSFHPTLPLDPPDNSGADDDDGLTERIVEALSPTPLPIADIARASGCTARQCAARLMELELEGRALTHAGGLASRV